MMETIQKNRKNETCDLRAWYFQMENNTLAYGILKGIHGVRKDIPKIRTYFFCSGEGILTINGKDNKVGEGTILTIPAQGTYDLRSVGNDPLKFFVDIGVKLDLDTIPSS
jgi:hypothetical protein